MCSDLVSNTSKKGVHLLLWPKAFALCPLLLSDAVYAIHIEEGFVFKVSGCKQRQVDVWGQGYGCFITTSFTGGYSRKTPAELKMNHFLRSF